MDDIDLIIEKYESAYKENVLLRKQNLEYAQRIKVLENRSPSRYQSRYIIAPDTTVIQGMDGGVITTMPKTIVNSKLTKLTDEQKICPPNLQIRL